MSDPHDHADALSAPLPENEARPGCEVLRPLQETEAHTCPCRCIPCTRAQPVAAVDPRHALLACLPVLTGHWPPHGAASLQCSATALEIMHGWMQNQSILACHCLCQTEPHVHSFSLWTAGQSKAEASGQQSRTMPPIMSCQQDRKEAAHGRRSAGARGPWRRRARPGARSRSV